MTVIGASPARATATAVLPTPVGPTMTGVGALGPSKPSFQLFFGQLYQTRAPVDVVRWKRRGEQARNELAHFVDLERLARFDRRPAGVGRGKALKPVLPAT